MPYTAARIAVLSFVVVLQVAALGLAAPGHAAVLSPERASADTSKETFGATTRGKPKPLPANTKRVSPYTLADQATVTHLVAYLDGKGRGRGREQRLRLVIYGDHNRRPRALLGMTREHHVRKGAAGRWVALALADPLELEPGRYHLGIHSGASGRVARYGVVGGRAARRQNRNMFHAGPARVFGRAQTSSQGIAINGQNKDRKAPTKPQGLAVSGMAESSLTLAWTSATDNVGVAGYRLYRNGAHIAVTSDLTHVYGDLVCGATYTLGVEAYDAAGNVSRRSSVSAATATCTSPPAPGPDTKPPSVPQGLTMVAATGSSITLAWNSSTDDVGVAGYRMYRNGSAVATTTQTTYTYTGLACGTTYTLALEAFDAAGNVSNKEEATTSRSTTSCGGPGSDTQAPSVPQGLTMTGATATSITLAWNPSTDDVGVAGYRMYRNGSAVATTTQTTYTYTGLACGTTYTLALEAFDAAGNVSNNEEATTWRSTTPCTAPPPPPPGGDPAASVFVASSGSDANACTQVAPCASFSRAYRVAQPGETVEVAGGWYPGQSLVADSAKGSSSAMVVFRPTAGATVTLHGLRFGSSVSSTDGPRNVTVKDVRIADASGKQRGIAAFNGTNNVLLENLDAANFYLNGVKNFTVRGGDWGPCLTTSTGTQSNEAVDGCSNSKIDGNPNNENIVIEDAVFHDYRIIPGSGAHFECMFVVNGTNITIRRNKFRNCEFYDIFFQNPTQNGPITNVLIENNWFDTPWNGAGVQNRTGALEFSPRRQPFNNFLIRNNSFFNTGMSLNGDADGTVYSNFHVIGNIANKYWAGCYPSVNYSFNLWVNTASGCGATDRTLTAFPYVNPVMGAAGDYHLTGGIAVDFVATSAPEAAAPNDINRSERPRGAARDAGSHELR